MSRATKKKPTEAAQGRYSAIPHSLLDSVAYQGCSFSAKSLLLELARQHTGANNGHLHCVYSWLNKRGWQSSATSAKALAELIDRKLIIKTRQGGFNAGACKYALSWLAITNFVGLDITQPTYRQGAYLLMDELPKIKGVSSDSDRAKPVISSDSEPTRNATPSESELVEGCFGAWTPSESEHNVYHHIHAPEINAPDATLTRHAPWPWEFAEFTGQGFQLANAQFIKSATIGAITWH